MKRNKQKRQAPPAPNKNPQTPVYSTVVVTPPRREINDIGTWKSALRSADIGIRWPLYDLYASILLDGQVTDAINKRIEAITDADIHFTADGKPVKEMEDLVDSAEFERLLEDIMWSRFWGITVDEFTFIPGFDFNNIPRKHIRPRQKVIVRRQSDTEGISYAGDPMVIQWGRDDDLGLLLKIAPYVIYKRGGFGDWAQFVELFGMPIRIGKYNSMDDASRRLLIQAFETAGSAPYMVVPKESDVETTLMSGTANGALYNDFRQACNEEILITILGQTMTTQSGASLSQSQVHLAVQEKKHRSDRRFVIRMLNKYFIPLLERRGYPVQGGKFIFVDKKDELSVTDLKALSGILPVPRSWAYDKYGIPQPEDDEPILEPLRTEAAPAPSGRRDTTQPLQPDDDPDDDTDPPVRNADRRGFWQRLRDFFGAAPVPAGAGTTRMSDDDTLDGRLMADVWDGEEFFSPELFAYFSEDFLKAVQTGLERPLENVDTGFTYNAPDDVFRTALETNLYHFSAAKTLAEVQELNRLLREAKDYADFREKAAKVARAFNDTWQRTEYDTAVLTAESTANYRRLRQKSDIFPFWQYLTVADGRVREQHRKLHGVILPENDPLWDKIYPPNGWNCRCRVRGLMEHQAKDVDFKEMRQRVLDYLGTGEWKMLAAQGWGVNRCDTAQIFTADQMYIRKFPEHAASYLKRLTADRWKLPTVQQMKQQADGDMPPRVERDEQAVWDIYSHDGKIALTDYDGRTVTISREQFFSHTTAKGRDNRITLWDAMLDALKHPDEVWLNNELEKNVQNKAEELNTYCLMKFYRDEVVAVNYRIEGEELVLKTWYIMQTNLDKSVAYMKRKIWDKRRFGLLIKKR